MSEARYDWLGDRWTILSPDRDARPNDFRNLDSKSNDCPFCFGHESNTPPPILELGKDKNNGQWMVRVFANKYPATHPFSLDQAGHENLFGLERQATPESCEARTLFHQPGKYEGASCDIETDSIIHQSRTFFGAHEVIVESSDHVSSISHLSIEHVQMAVEAYACRLRELRLNPELRYAVLFKNAGPEAGASLVHTHSQLIACNLVPTSFVHRLARLDEYHQRHGRCFLCDVLHQELEVGSRIVTTTDHFVAYCPYASRLPFTVNLIPKAHASSFEDMEAEYLTEFATLLRRAIRWIESIQKSTSYNFVIHTMPWACDKPATYHWYVEIFPRLSTAAGFEWASECFINTESPESAACRFRKADKLTPS